MARRIISYACSFLFLFVSISHASADSRQDLIKNTLNCIDQSKNTKDISWQDICYTDVSGQAKKEAIVTSELDGYENSAERQNLDQQRHLADISAPPAPDYQSPPPPKPLIDTNDHFKNFLPSIDYKATSPNSLISFNLGLYAGYRQDDFNWNIADTDGQPDVLSDLTWEDLEMRQIQATASIVLLNNFLIEGMGSYADIFEGENQDSDYLGDGRSLEFSRSNNQADDGEVTEWSAGVGYRIPINFLDEFLEREKTWLSFLGGYSKHELNVIATDLFQTVPATGLGPPALHTNYWAEWHGPWAGLQLEGKIKKLTGLFRYEYHWADYYGSANWNLRSDLLHPTSFEHITESTGQFYTLGLDYELTNTWSLNFKTDVKQWKSGPGVDRVFLVDGTAPTTQLNGVDWNSLGFSLGATFYFQ